MRCSSSGKYLASNCFGGESPVNVQYPVLDESNIRNLWRRSATEVVRLSASALDSACAGLTDKSTMTDGREKGVLPAFISRVLVIELRERGMGGVSVELSPFVALS